MATKAVKLNQEKNEKRTSKLGRYYDCHVGLQRQLVSFQYGHIGKMALYSRQKSFKSLTSLMFLQKQSISFVISSGSSGCFQKLVYSFYRMTEDLEESGVPCDCLKDIYKNRCEQVPTLPYQVRSTYRYLPINNKFMSKYTSFQLGLPDMAVNAIHA